MDPFGYTHLEFYINGGASSGQNPTIAGKKLSERGITVQSNIYCLEAGSFPQTRRMVLL